MKRATSKGNSAVTAFSSQLLGTHQSDLSSCRDKRDLHSRVGVFPYFKFSRGEIRRMEVAVTDWRLLRVLRLRHLTFYIDLKLAACGFVYYYEQIVFTISSSLSCWSLCLCPGYSFYLQHSYKVK